MIPKRLRILTALRHISLLGLFLLSLATGRSASAQTTDQPIVGVVTDEKGDALPGVSIVLKGTSRGTTTDGSGKYRIVVPNGRAVLVVSFVGYVRQEVPANGRSTVDVQLVNDDKSLDEVVVVGYGTQKKINLTGAVSTIDSKVIENRPSSNLANALQGVSPGLTVIRTSGQPGSEADGISLQIRGVTSANGNVNPLVVLDGVSVPITTMTTLNPNDVESISVLKDAAAAAIYGAQAAGGVILITTKKGKAGKVQFNYSTQYGTDWAINVPERMGLLEEMQMGNLSNKNAGQPDEYTAVDLQRAADGIEYVINPADTTRYTYYNQKSLPDQLLRKYSSMKTHNLSARGGTDKLNFLISGGYYGKQGVFKVGPDDFSRYNFRINLGSQLTKHVGLDARMAYTLEQTNRTALDASGSNNLIYQIYRLRERNPYFTPEGRYAAANSTYAAVESGGYNRYSRNYFDGTFTGTIGNFVKGLTIRAVAGLQYRPGSRQVFNRTVPLWERTRISSYLNTNNSYAVTNELVRNTNIQGLINYDTKLGDKHTFGVLAGYQWEDYREQSVTTTALNLVSNDLPTLNLGDDKTKSNNESVGTRAFQSFFGRFNYNYAGKYLIEGTLRQDESSRLAPGLRKKLFPSASAGWNMHLEPWFTNTLPFVSEFKLRGSWGRLGGALGTNIGNYDYLSQLTRGSALVLGDSRTSYIYQGTIPSTALSWETIETTNGGIDFGFFQNKLQFSGDYYVKYNSNMLTPQQLPGTIGVGTARKNNGELKSWGWEAEIRYRDRIGKNFSYNMSANFFDNQNRLNSFNGRNTIGAGINNLVEGFPVNTIWGYQTAGYFTSADEVKSSSFQDNRAGMGDVKYVDLNGDNRLTVGQGTVADHGDLVMLGTTQPRYQFGFTLGAQWKGFDLTVFIQGVGKRNILPTPESIGPLLQGFKQALAIHRDYWTPDNPNALFPRPYKAGSHNYVPSDKWTLNASYARLKNIQFGYTLPSAFTQKIKVSQARFYFTGQDLLTISGLSKFKGYYDPEARDNIDADYPYFATAAVGLNLSF
ncbi:SusC/RagA family TonB-linked outer membrane protein [uncultured Fibrella sp.]|uniref:SusC/RagA family TonB-linked outer membrane protein n=1 Tax=uncultured Fibrella sp. TaxID=1284596 RepID=UPI0035CC96C9